jgi:ribonuclease E
MLINATQEEELRMAMVDGQRLYDLNIELPASERKKANIYKGQITRVEPSLEAAFVNYGADRHGFLPLKEISSEYFVREVEGGSKPNIRDVLREGQDIVVQIDKEERGNKGAALTTFVSLAGRFIVLKPNKARSGGVSRRIVGEDRDLARKSMREIEVPDGMSVILRTAGIDRSGEELTWDLENLMSVWEAIKKVVVERHSPFLIYRESNAVVRALRDYLTNDIGEILIDDDSTFEEAREFVEQVMPHNLRKLKHYNDPVPLFTRYQIETQIESAFAHSVTLPSGGSLVIDHTEALVSIDINSARATKGGDIEATALNTNVEAADEIARQLRLRDLGGLVVIDFIDMGPQKNQREVENRLREAVRQDRARVQLGKISRFGLLEMSRQRLRPSLGESSYLVCPRCSGIGNIRSVESLALAILRIIGEEARKERTAKVIAQLPIEVATYLLNEKRDWVQSLESRHDTQVILVANPALETPHYQIRRVRDDQVDLPENAGISYTLAESEDEPEITQSMQDKKPAEIAAITTVVQTTPAPPRPEPEPEPEPEKKPGLLARIASIFGGSKDDDTPSEKPARKRTRKQSDGRRRGGQRRGEGRDRQQGKKAPQRKKQSKKKASKKKSARKPRPKKSADQADSQRTEDAEQQPAAKEGRPNTAKRRSRGGRRRRRGGDGSGDTGASSRGDKGDAERDAKPANDRSADSKPSDDKPANDDKTAKQKSPGDKQTRPQRAPRDNDAPKDRDSQASEAKTEAPVNAKRERTDAKPESPRPADGQKAVSEHKEKPATKPAAPEAAAPERARPKPAPADKPAPAAGNGDSRPASGNGPDKAAAPAPKAKEKPEGRLLPWETSPGSGAESTDKD